MGLSLGTALGILPLLGLEGIVSLVVALVSALAGTALALTRYGRLVLSSLRGSGPGENR